MLDYPAGIFFVAAGLILLYLVLRYAQPYPLPEIPRRHDTSRLWGDLGSLITHRRQHGDVFPWPTRQCHELQSPIIQLFMLPFAKRPVVVVNDYQTAQEIVKRRVAEFDVSPLITNNLALAVPGATIAMASHPTFKAQRRLWACTMTTEFLHNVASHKVLKAGEELVALWREKVRVTGGLPFRADRDLRFCSLDATWAAAVGSELGAVRSQLHCVSTDGNLKIYCDESGEAQFPPMPLPPLYVVMDTILKATWDLFYTPFPMYARIRKLLSPNWRISRRKKDEAMRNLWRDARTKFSDFKQQQPTCAMEEVLFREGKTLEKEGLETLSSEDSMIDELFVWLVNGHETTATSLSWGIKYLATAPDVQRQLRADITAAVGPSITSGKALLDANIPLLEATTWEILRLARTFNGVLRIATVDTQILGYPVPKDTQVFLSTDGFSVLDTADFTDASHSDAKGAAGVPPPWRANPKDGFFPSRWLKETDKQAFDLKAGPVMPFGGGRRGCFGKIICY